MDDMLADDTRVSCSNPKKGKRGSFRTPAVLLPVAERVDTDAKGTRNRHAIELDRPCSFGDASDLAAILVVALLTDGLFIAVAVVGEVTIRASSESGDSQSSAAVTR